MADSINMKRLVIFCPPEQQETATAIMREAWRDSFAFTAAVDGAHGPLLAASMPLPRAALQRAVNGLHGLKDIQLYDGSLRDYRSILLDKGYRPIPINTALAAKSGETSPD